MVAWRFRRQKYSDPRTMTVADRESSRPTFDRHSVVAVSEFKNMAGPSARREGDHDNQGPATFTIASIAFPAPEFTEHASVPVPRKSPSAMGMKGNRMVALVTTGKRDLWVEVCTTLDDSA